MKRIVAIFCLLSLVFSFSSCSYKSRTRNAEINLGESQIFSQDELQSAADVIISGFLEGEIISYLQKLWYNEEESAGVVKNNPSYQNLDDKNKIALFGDFHAGNKHPTNSNQDLEGDVWILVRENENSDWSVKDSGF